MTRFYLCLALLLTPLFTLPPLLFRALPYDAAPVWDLLDSTQDCPLPCLMHIRPRLTTMDEALAVLRGHRWVREVNIISTSLIAWEWNGSQPDLIDTGRVSYVQNTTRQGRDGFQLVELVVVSTHLRLGDIWLALGPPDYEHLDTNGGTVFYSAVYTDPPVEFFASSACPLTGRWQAQVSLSPVRDYTAYSRAAGMHNRLFTGCH